ncbi:hypothetical protein CkaCkLH20_00837 [Colletotrichum karsti]|uniref:Uncharacterized protein n=1 Tax=Colletotrichum karsti TaxID=1095194 RepID=A0A9P6IIC0_9PEZI|nr:uncharacterized protein CkaCkLH20_00837 [Colletotrichum karsti]KAF9881691.1 hypothetical protein CkaCkLH20_00837 [Colletotrichum karsti]
MSEYQETDYRELTPRQKLYIIILLLQAAFVTTTALSPRHLDPRQRATPNPNLPSPSRRWTCLRTGGAETSRQDLRATHAVFNRLYGRPRLTGDPNECFVARCDGFHFSWCNLGNGRRREDVAARDVVAGEMDPGSGVMCLAAVGGEGFDADLFYFWGREESVRIPNYGGGRTVRSC